VSAAQRDVYLLTPYKPLQRNVVGAVGKKAGGAGDKHVNLPLNSSVSVSISSQLSLSLTCAAKCRVGGRKS